MISFTNYGVLKVLPQTFWKITDQRTRKAVRLVLTMVWDVICLKIHFKIGLMLVLLIVYLLTIYFHY